MSFLQLGFCLTLCFYCVTASTFHLDFSNSVNCGAQKNTCTSREVTFLHFNDLYRIDGFKDKSTDPETPTGGVSRAKYVISQTEATTDPIITFAGDLFFPSALSSMFNGEQMVDTVNRLGVDAATVGNHEFDKGMDTFKNLVGQSTFTWLSGNIFEPGEPNLNGLARTKIVERNGLRIGILSAQTDWRVSVSSVSLDYVDIVRTAKILAADLKSRGCDLIVALTHAIETDDAKILAEVPLVDLVLGGHDHYLVNERHEHGKVLWKSASDLAYFGKLKVRVAGEGASRAVQVWTETIPLTGPTDPAMDVVVQGWLDQVEASSKTIGTIVGQPLIGGDTGRGRETNMGNLVADAFQWEGEKIAAALGLVKGVDYTALVTMMNSGGIRADSISTGPFTTLNVIEMLPFDNFVVLLEVPFSLLEESLVNSAKLWNKGGFAQISGFEVTLDTNPANPGIKSIDLGLGSTPGPNDKILISTLSYMASGGDQYPFADAPRIVSARDGRDMREVFQDYVVKELSGTIDVVEDGRLQIDSSATEKLMKILHMYSEDTMLTLSQKFKPQRKQRKHM
eukprot:TRINITY_DN68106_c13_g1_i2.p1 TRINITY_DN68106_c13_g1~~TRINITY_DN68106_c13_g1_i2.p1  ORF type:complete len:566 (+),score=83.38 TRINITY_DN68106_c13_g1_i2:32-1729(+)